MTTNKPGSVDQNPYYDCAGCYDYQTHHAEDLRVHKDRAWCDSCWDYHKDGDEALPFWHELERFVPALQAECEQLRQALVEARDLVAEWGAYADEYSKEKHGLERDIARLDAVISGEE